MFSLSKVSGYLWNSFVYLGKEISYPKKANISQEEQAIVKEFGKSGVVVPKLMSELYGDENHLYFDN